MGGEIRGRLVCPRRDGPTLGVLADGLLRFDGRGRIEAIGPAPRGCEVPETRPGAVWLPGFVDAHVHFPQTRIIGSATGPLLDWLARSVFPEEGRFAQRAYAELVAREFCSALIGQGTTTAAVFSSSHAGATDALFAEFDRRGLRGWLGLTLMDRGAPEAVVCAAADALAACEVLRSKWHGHDGRLQFCVTPRFGLSCTPELLRAAGAFAARHDLPVQTHLSENQAEIAATAVAFPGARDYLDVYVAAGLAGRRSLFAHCIHLSQAEWDTLAHHDCGVAHCPDSNFFLGSGCMPLDAPLSRGIRTGLGTDVGAGRTFSLRRVAAAAYDAGLITGSTVSAEQLLWLATAGGARAMGLEHQVGHLEVGCDADVVAIDVPAEGDLFDALVFRRDAGPVAEARVRGRVLAAGS